MADLTYPLQINTERFPRNHHKRLCQSSSLASSVLRQKPFRTFSLAGAPKSSHPKHPRCPTVHFRSASVPHSARGYGLLQGHNGKPTLGGDPGNRGSLKFKGAGLPLASKSICTLLICGLGKQANNKGRQASVGAKSHQLGKSHQCMAQQEENLSRQSEGAPQK